MPGFNNLNLKQLQELGNTLESHYASMKRTFSLDDDIRREDEIKKVEKVKENILSAYDLMENKGYSAFKVEGSRDDFKRLMNHAQYGNKLDC